jgi:hypothetical protein
MTNVFESMKDLFTVDAVDKQQNPLHVGEVTHVWVLVTLIEEGLTVYQQSLNTTKDDELIHALRNSQQAATNIAENLRSFLRKEGIPLPPASEDKPLSDPDSIPLGVKHTDKELANLTSAKIAAEITLLGQALAVCIRDDIGKLFFEIQYEIFKFGSSFKKLMNQRGWLKIPPYYYPPGHPVK